MGSTYNLQEDCMLFHGDLTKLRRQRESLVSKKAIGKTNTLYMQHAILILLRHHHSVILCEKHRIWSKKHTDPVNTAHVLPVQSVHTNHGAMQILFTGVRTTICPCQHWNSNVSSFYQANCTKTFPLQAFRLVRV